MSDGFGDICFDEKPDFCLGKLKRVDIPVRPLFLSVPDPPFSYTDILSEGRCLCNRFGVVGPPIQPFGNIDSKYVFVGRDPSECDVEQEEVLSSNTPVGSMFVECLEHLGLVREDVYITNTNLCRGPGSTYPTPDQMFACSSFHRQEFQSLVGMEYLFLMGSHAFHTMTGVYGQINSFFGKYFEADIFGKCVKIIPIYHPEVLVSNQEIREQVFSILDEIGGG